jgi:hypothetical protein
MMTEHQDVIQLLNTAVIKSKERKINTSFESKLNAVCNSPVMNSLIVAIDHLSEEQKISKDHAAVQIVETIRELDLIWNDYVLMEGIGKLKEVLKNTIH